MPELKRKVTLKRKSVSVTPQKKRNILIPILVICGILIIATGLYFILSGPPKPDNAASKAEGAVAVINDTSLNRPNGDTVANSADIASNAKTNPATVAKPSNGANESIENKTVNAPTQPTTKKSGESSPVQSDKGTKAATTTQPKSSSSNIPYQKGQVYKVYQFPFGDGSCSQTNSDLDKLVDVLKQNPALKISISAYTDNVGDASYNQSLSEKRAKAINDYVVSKGIEARRLSFQGKGISSKYPSNAENRRAEFTLSE